MSIFDWLKHDRPRKQAQPKPEQSGYQVYCTEYDRIIPATKINEVLGPLWIGGETSLNEAWNAMLFGMAPIRELWQSHFVTVCQKLRGALSPEDLEDCVVCILIDHSGSMRGRSITFAALAADAVQKALRDLDCKVEVLGFTTSTWHGGLSRSRWARKGKPRNPGRLCDLLHIVYRSADDMRSAPIGLPLKDMLRDDLLKENVDGEALEWAAGRLRLRPETHKFLIVMSDGAPVDNATLTENPGSYLWDHLNETIGSIRAADDIALIGIGLSYDVQTLYPNSVMVEDYGTLGAEMFDVLGRTMLARIPNNSAENPDRTEADTWLPGLWKKAEDETDEAYAQRLRANGDMPLDIIKALRSNTKMGLDAAHKLVVSDREIEIFLRANRERGVERRGMIRLLRRVYGCTNQSAIAHIDRSGLWRETESLP
ncbi:hypothetical protein [Rhizobium sp. FKL33]|uniref:cobaltochelatase CobT-related protein n=1 Tax=Rhizobium sp. FKL33 TaxID=2562307 RepID=UPI0010C0C7FF|nr:hypothetical protein [Rhizobium sp. FKL33]